MVKFTGKIRRLDQSLNILKDEEYFMKFAKKAELLVAEAERQGTLNRNL
jgi:hypothetical protein